MSLYASYHKELKYIWLWCGSLHGFPRYNGFSLTGVGRAYPLGIPSLCHWIRLIIRNNIYGLGVGIGKV